MANPAGYSPPSDGGIQYKYTSCSRTKIQLTDGFKFADRVHVKVIVLLQQLASVVSLCSRKLSVELPTLVLFSLDLKLMSSLPHRQYFLFLSGLCWQAYGCICW